MPAPSSRWDNDKTIPTILTTSQKLSTGVDARNIRNIGLMRPIQQIIEFKQIIGRGTGSTTARTTSPWATGSGLEPDGASISPGTEPDSARTGDTGSGLDPNG